MADVFAWLLLLVPVSAALAYLTTASSLWTFAAATVGVIPLSEWIRRATEHLARRAGPAIGGLLNVTFGNTAELVLALFVLAGVNIVTLAEGDITHLHIGFKGTFYAGWPNAMSAVPVAKDVFEKRPH